MEEKGIYSPEEALGNYDNVIILIVTGWYEGVPNVLNQCRKVENVDYFNIELFVTVFMMYRYNELVSNKLYFWVTQRCSLKCKKCDVFVPYM